jgi:hypothetical protein
MIFLASLKDFQFFLEVTFVVNVQLKKKSLFYAYHWLRKIVPHVAIVCFYFNALKKVTVDCSFAKLVFQRQCSCLVDNWPKNTLQQ